MKHLILVAMVTLGLTEAANASKCEGFFPKNNKYIGLGLVNEGIDEGSFKAVLDKLVTIYNPIVASHGYQLQFNYLWEDGTVNSDTSTEGQMWVINSYGGLARYKGMTMDGYAAVACHELGHHLGGAPLYSFMDMSVEGQSDYHVGTKCLRKYFAADDNVTLMAKATVDPMVLANCSAAFVGNANEIAICERASMAGFVVSDILRDLEQAGPIAFNTPDPAVVKETYQDHPHAQCRLDTYFEGALCNVPDTVEFSTTDVTVGACMSGLGARSHCWFAEDKN